MEVANFGSIKLSTLCFVLYLIICEIISSEVPRPRGVSLSRASLYNSEENFVCFDGSKTIPFSQVNDDYCDCADASDEPGTAACPHGTFHCTNAGHRPMNIDSSRVNDGICDCCDGSDEYANKKIKCVNNCVELGRAAREEAERKAELLKAGKQLKEELSQKGKQLKQEKREKLAELEQNKEEALKVKAEKEELKNKAEELENSALAYYRELEEQEKQRRLEAEEAKNKAEATESFHKFDSNQDGKVDLAELQTRQTFDKDRNGEVSEEEAKYFLNNEESVDIESFIKNAWLNIKPYLMMDAGMFKGPESTEAPRGEIEDLETGDYEPTEEGHDTEEKEEHEEEEEEEATEEPPATTEYDEETKKLVESATAARNEFAEAERNVRELESEIKGIEEYLEKDFGADEEFAVLEGQCFDYSDHEYVYKFCPFDRTVQQPKSSAPEVRLGGWSRWAGPASNKYEIMLYERGQACWNGPQRSTTVKILCGSENRLTSVTEPNKCEYVFEFITPAACSEQSSDNHSDTVHDEL